MILGVVKVPYRSRIIRFTGHICQLGVVDAGGLEPPAPRVSGECSDQLSYASVEVPIYVQPPEDHKPRHYVENDSD